MNYDIGQWLYYYEDGKLRHKMVHEIYDDLYILQDLAQEDDYTTRTYNAVFDENHIHTIDEMVKL